MYRFSTAFTRTRALLGTVVVTLSVIACIAMPASALAASAPVAAIAVPTLAAAAGSGEETGSLESAASKASETGRKIAMSLIALGFAIASIVLAFKRDFKEAAGIFAVGLVAILLATPAGVNVLQDTVNTLFGAS
ncbi:MAG: hypothetical protein WBQ21_07835 [Solirubrobacteraceae bacterium]